MIKVKHTVERTRVFCSYSSADRSRVTGLSLLLEALENRVFLDHKTIKPGDRWEAKLQEGLDQANVLLVFWTKNASQSDWVRKEIEHFHVNYPDRPIVPIIGDETPLTELLKKYQHSDFCPLINELLELKRNLISHGVKQSQVEKEILNRLHEAGIEIAPKHRKKLFILFTSGGLLGLASTPALVLKSMGNRAVESFSQLTWGQVVSLAVATASGVVICSITNNHLLESDDVVIKKTDSQLIDTRPSDVWLGMWTLTVGETTKSDTYFIQRSCNEYVIKFKRARILEISKERLRFQEGGKEFDIKMINNESSTVEVVSPNPNAISKLLFRKVVGAPITIEQCVE